MDPNLIVLISEILNTQIQKKIKFLASYQYQASLPAHKHHGTLNYPSQGNNMTYLQGKTEFFFILKFKHLSV